MLSNPTLPGQRQGVVRRRHWLTWKFLGLRVGQRESGFTCIEITCRNFKNRPMPTSQEDQWKMNFRGEAWAILVSLGDPDTPWHVKHKAANPPHTASPMPGLVPGRTPSPCAPGGAGNAMTESRGWFVGIRSGNWDVLSESRS